MISDSKPAPRRVRGRRLPFRPVQCGFAIACLACVAILTPANVAAQPARGPLVVSEAWPECTNLETWMRDIMRIDHLENAGETAQAKAFFRWLRLFSRMATGGMIQAHEGDYGKERYVLDSHKNLFVYGWGFCDTSSRIAEAAWSEFKKDRSSAERVCVMHDNGGFHTMYRLRLDGNHGAFDPRYGYYVVERDAPDARVLDWAEVGNDENVLRNRGFRNRSQPYFEYFGTEWERALLIKPGYFKTEDEWRKAGGEAEIVFGNGMYAMGTRFHDMDFDLARGVTIERFWDGAAKKFYVPVSPSARREEPFLPSGRFYRVTETMFAGNWVNYDPNYLRAKPYLVTVPTGEGYKAEVAGGRTLGQAWGRITYEPDLRELPEIVAPGSTLAPARSVPLLAPAAPGGEGQAVFDFRSPYVLVDAVLSGELVGADADRLRLEFRVLRAKATNASEPDVWSQWTEVRNGPGAFSLPLGRERSNGRDTSVTGTYRFQVRVSVGPNAARRGPAGMSRVKLAADFENGIMSIPQIFAGRNTLHFKVRDAARLRGPVTVTYKYQTAEGENARIWKVSPAEFRGNTATGIVDTPGLLRCNSLVIAY